MSPAPSVFDPWRFDDIPLPLGYRLVEDADQLAVSIGGDRLRRMDATLEQAQPDRSMDGSRLLQWYHTQLGNQGWVPMPTDNGNRDVRRYRKRRPGNRIEHLRLETGRADRRAIIHLTLTGSRKADGAEEGDHG